MPTTRHTNMQLVKFVMWSENMKKYFLKNSHYLILQSLDKKMMMYKFFFMVFRNISTSRGNPILKSQLQQ